MYVQKPHGYKVKEAARRNWINGGRSGPLIQIKVISQKEVKTSIKSPSASHKTGRFNSPASARTPACRTQLCLPTKWLRRDLGMGGVMLYAWACTEHVCSSVDKSQRNTWPHCADSHFDGAAWKDAMQILNYIWCNIGWFLLVEGRQEETAVEEHSLLSGCVVRCVEALFVFYQTDVFRLAG